VRLSCFDKLGKKIAADWKNGYGPYWKYYGKFKWKEETKEKMEMV